MRRPRLLQEGARYHVTARINRQEMILAHESIRDFFLSFVSRAKKKYHFRLWNFCLMGNHIHFLIEPERGENLSAIMRWILGVFASAYNRQHGLSGHVWGERFHSRILNTLREFILAFAYIDENPVKAGLVGSALYWRHSGLYHARTGRRDILDDIPPWLGWFFPDYTVQSE